MHILFQNSDITSKDLEIYNKWRLSVVIRSKIISITICERDNNNILNKSYNNLLFVEIYIRRLKTNVPKMELLFPARKQSQAHWFP